MAPIASTSRLEWPSVRTLQVRRQRLLVAWVVGIVAASLGAALLLRLLRDPLEGIIAVCVLLPALLVWLWRSPVRGVYVLFGFAVILEQYYSATYYSDDIGRYLPVFQDISTWSHIQGLSFSVAELFMALVAILWIVRGVADRDLHFVKGPLWRPLALYMLMVGVGEVHGLTSGGVFKTSLWEVRSQVYMLVGYILASNLVRTRRQVMGVLWILVAGTTLKAIQGVWRYYVTLHHNTSGIDAIMPHEQSYFFVACLTLAPILYLFGGPKRLKWAVTLSIPFLFIANMANNRRAAILALALGLLGLLIFTAVINKRRRKFAIAVLVLLAVLIPPYYVGFQNRAGVLGEPARAIGSAFNPDPRDASSNLYRVNEDKDILATMRMSPIYGYGFGKPMFTPFPLANISNTYVFWNIMPHDSILWIWMRLGTIGYILLWLLIGRAIVFGLGLARKLTDPVLQGLALFLTLLIFEEIVVAYLDLQWSAYRNLITMGVVFALLTRLKSIDQRPTRLAEGSVRLEWRTRSRSA